MKTQISRYSHDPKKRYSGVYQQQGRMITDADWNELVEVLKARLDGPLSELVGSGVPRRNGLSLRVVDGALRIVRGALYVHGLRAELRSDADSIALTEQPDFPRAPAAPADARLYADLWERTVVSIEDAALRDPGLHGADTCSRTETMLQLKWCSEGVDPADPLVNPSQGNARIALALWDNSAATERIDPCLTQTAQGSRIGNYLFRLEVHDAVTHKSASTETLTLTLKWSSENGAEQQSLRTRDDSGVERLGYEHLPPEFTAGHYAYELYEEACEKHLGVHLTGFTPSRGTFRGFDALTGTPPSIAGRPADSIRRWDGHCSIELTRPLGGTQWTPVLSGLSGVDMDEALQSSTPGHGYVERVDEGGHRRLRLSLEALILTIDLDASAFVVGDFWMAVVREGAEFYPGTAIDRRVEVLHDGLPLGVTHHYLELARIHGGALQPYLSGGPKARSLDFPPLTALSADRIGYDAEGQGARWDDINELGGPRRPLTVQEAIDDLVGNLESSDVSYALPPCELTAYGVDTLNALLRGEILGKVVGADGKTRAKMQDVLDALLCKLDARHLPFDASVNAVRWADVGEQVWTQQFGGVGDDQNHALAVDALGNIIVSGSFEGTAAFGDRVLTSAGSTDLYLAKLDGDGQMLWAKRFGSSGAQQGQALATDRQNNILIVGSFSGTLDFGSGSSLTSAGSTDTFIAKLTPNGDCLWARALGGGVVDIGYSLAVDANAEVIVAGFFSGSVVVAGQTLTSAGGSDVFVLKFGADGALRWAKRFGGVGYDIAYGVATDAAQNIVLIGKFEGSVDFGGGALSATGSSDVFVAKLAPAGTHLWSKSFGGPRADYGRGVAVDGSGNVLVSGYFQQSINFGGSALAAQGDYDVFVAKLQGSNGAHVWSRAFGGISSEYGQAIAIDPTGNVAIAGYFSGSVDLGGGALSAEGGYDCFVLLLDTSGAHLKSARFGGRGATFGRNLVLLPGAAWLVAGSFEGTSEFGGEPLTSAGASDAFVAKLRFSGGGPATVQQALDTLLRELDSADIAYAVPSCGTPHDAVRRRLPSLRDLDDGDATRVRRVLDALVCELDAGTIPYARGDAVGVFSIADLMVKKTGDAMSGALTIDSGVPSEEALRVRGVTTTRGLKLEAAASVPDKAVLTLDKPSGLAVWRETSLTAWTLSGGNLSTDPNTVTGKITLGAPAANALVVSQGRLGLGTPTPEARFHIAPATANGPHILDGVETFGSWTGMYGRALNWDTDSLFLGMRNEGGDRKDAIIGWADNGNDALRFVFAPVGASPVEMLRMSQASGVVVPHARLGDSSSRSIEIGSQDPVTGNTRPNGRMGFPGYGVRHGQIRWVPSSASFELIDSSAGSPSGDYGVNAPAVNLRAGTVVATGFQGPQSLHYHAVQTGTVASGRMDGSGDRFVRTYVNFPQRFNQVPTVVLTISFMDIDQRFNLRLDVYAEDVTIAGFYAVFHTWADTLVYNARAVFTAHGV